MESSAATAQEIAVSTVVDHKEKESENEESSNHPIAKESMEVVEEKKSKDKKAQNRKRKRPASKITAKHVSKFTEKEIRDGLDGLLKKNILNRKQLTDIGTLKKTPKDVLIRMLPVYILPNLVVEILEQKQLKKENAPVFNNKQSILAEKLEKCAIRHILSAIKKSGLATEGPDMKVNVSAMKKQDLIAFVVCSEESKEICKFAQQIHDEQQVKEKQERDLREPTTTTTKEKSKASKKQKRSHA